MPPKKADSSAPRFRREDAMAATPVHLPVAGIRERNNGGIEITVEFQRPQSWRRWLGVSGTMKKTFGLDRLGREVYDLCDGKRSVREVIEAFAETHRISRTEAELAVTRFMRVLVSKGILGMSVPRRAGAPPGTPRAPSE